VLKKKVVNIGLFHYKVTHGPIVRLRVKLTQSDSRIYVCHTLYCTIQMLSWLSKHGAVVIGQAISQVSRRSHYKDVVNIDLYSKQLLPTCACSLHTSSAE